MNKKYQKALFIFRRDLRLEDNTGLIASLKESEQVIPLFIFDNRQTDRIKNQYFSEVAFDFLLNSLRELDQQLQSLGSKLYVFAGQPDKIIDSLITKDQIEAVFVNKDYTPFALNRDLEIKKICQKHQIVFEAHRDLTLSPIEIIFTESKKKYTVFTPFKRKAATYPVGLPQKNTFSNYYSGKIKTKTSSISDFSAKIVNQTPLLKGGRQEAIKIIKNNQYLDNYQDRRNLPAENGTSRLSAHHKFGTISIRETYQMATAQADPEGQYVSELYWRDFYYYIAYHFPHIFKRSFLTWANLLEWTNNQEHFEAWCQGKTGVPIVDAGMRELNQTGWMHNRPRMIVASYLTKNLLINWQWGEKYFAQNLIDYDPAQNNGGWQWSASTGADPRPLRIFNPYIQAKNYDPEAKYIKKWVTELKNVDPKKLTDGKTQDFSQLAPGYPTPIIDQKKAITGQSWLTGKPK